MIYYFAFGQFLDIMTSRLTTATEILFTLNTKRSQEDNVKPQGKQNRSPLFCTRRSKKKKIVIKAAPRLDQAKLSSKIQNITKTVLVENIAITTKMNKDSHWYRIRSINKMNMNDIKTSLE